MQAKGVVQCQSGLERAIGFGNANGGPDLRVAWIAVGHQHGQTIVGTSQKDKHQATFGGFICGHGMQTL
jgi:hypothetical protein